MGKKLDAADRFYQILGYSHEPPQTLGEAAHDRRVACVRIERLYDERKQLLKIKRSVDRENRGQLRGNGCILCGANKRKDHTCGL